MNNIIQEKKDLLEKRIKALPGRSRENILKQLKNAKNLNDLMLIEKTLNLTEQITLATKHSKKENKVNKSNQNKKNDNNKSSIKQPNKQKDEFDDSSGPSNLQIRFAIKKDDYLWKIRTSSLSRDQKEDLIKVINDLDKDNSLDLLKKWELLKEVEKYIPR